MQSLGDPLALLAGKQKRLAEAALRGRRDLDRTGGEVDADDDALGARIVAHGHRDGAPADLEMIEMERYGLQRFVHNAVELNALRGGLAGR